MTETAWVLERAYRLSTAEVAKTIERTLQADALVVESEQEVFTAMIALKEGRGSFVDALGAKAGCSVTVTFDRRALRLPGFELLIVLATPYVAPPPLDLGHRCGRACRWRGR